ncbi:uncharacterized protein si:ch211-67e16.4 [Trichomycterus rosablanca]|uniref:uncharacterized protein si:ch211-67e16.4 n=1 Tax=Trichomycterus rosablanca TaxID=2290929 RepID=UPI002F359E65
MDVNLTISLMRGQMGVVIEKAVNAAVETVLGEMIRVVSLKFEQLRREMSAKEKENQDIRKMLETSRCQMKILRQKYISAVSVKEDRHAFVQQHRLTLGQFSVPTSTNTQHVPADPSRDQVPTVRRSSNTSTTSPSDFHPPAPLPVTAPVPITAPKPRTSEPVHTAKPQTVIHQEPTPTETYPNNEPHNQEVQGPAAHLGLKVETVNITVPENHDPLWGPTPQTSAEAEHTDLSDLNLLPVAQTSEALNPATSDCIAPPLKVKQEEAEVEIVEVKQEQVDPSTSEGPVIELQQDMGGAGMTMELPANKQCLQIPSSSVTEHSVFMGVTPSTYTQSQLAVAGTQRHMRPYCKDLTVYEDYKRKRNEVRKRSETRRRELEQSLPQALLADLVKERREKTRLRVARWRAKRKLQACLMAQTAHFNSTQVLYAQRNGRRRGVATMQQGNISLGAVQSESGVYTMPLQMGTSPLLTAQRLGMTEGQMQPGANAFLQQRTSATGSESYQ